MSYITLFLSAGFSLRGTPLPYILRAALAYGLLIVIGVPQAGYASSEDLLRLIPNDAIAAAKLNLTELRKSELFQKSQNQTTIQQLSTVYGVQPEDISEIIAVATYNEFTDQEGKKNTLYPQLTSACLASSRVPFQQATIIRKVVGNAPVFVEEGKEFYIRGYRIENEYFEAEALAIHFVDANTVMFGTAEGVFNLAFGLVDDQEKQPGVDEGLPDHGAVRTKLMKMATDAELIAVFSAQRLQEALKRELREDPLLSKYSYLESTFRQLEQASLNINIESSMEYEFRIDAARNEDIKGILDSIDYFQPTFLRWYKEYGNSTSGLPPNLRKNAQAALLEIRQGIGQSTKEIEDRSATWRGKVKKFDVFHNAFLIPGLVDARQRLGRLQSELSLMHIMLASENYGASQNKLIDAIRDKTGKPLLSWRVAVLPYLEMGNNPKLKEIRHDEPWDSPHNRQFIDQMPELFRSPYTNRSGHTTYRIVAGKGTLRDRFKEQSFAEAHEYDATPAIVIARGGPSAATIWTRPEPFNFDSKNPNEIFSGIESGDYLALLSDRQTVSIPSNLDSSSLSKLFAGEGGVELPQNAGLKWPDWRSLSYSSITEKSARNLSKIKETLEQRGRFIPPAIYAADGKPLLSWRVSILPSLGYRKLYDKFDLTQSWDSPHNKPLLEEMPRVFRRPGASNQSFRTCYMLPVGKETVFNSPEGGITHRQLRAIHGFAGTIVLVEVDEKYAVPWTQPLDLSYESEQPRKWLRGNYPHGFLATTPNMSAKVFPHEMSNETLQQWFANDIDKSSLSRFFD